MTIKTTIKCNPDTADYFKKIPFCNKHTVKSEIKLLKKH